MSIPIYSTDNNYTYRSSCKKRLGIHFIFAVGFVIGLLMGGCAVNYFYIKKDYSNIKNFKKVETEVEVKSRK